ncbi:MAG: hypothetical protein NDF55_10550 [archaeon GB-1867-005]|nr:hypothetical protein [Candidatus Culexmicrobium cathedralense]
MAGWVWVDRDLVDKIGKEKYVTDLPGVNYLEEVRKYAEKLREADVEPGKTYLIKIPVSELELNALEDLLYTYQPPKNITVLKHIVSHLWHKMVKQVD